MNTFIKGLLIVLFSICVFDAYSKPINKVNTFAYEGVMTGTRLFDLAVEIDASITSNKVKTITILINSGGGEVDGTLILRKLLENYKARGYQIEIIAYGRCMSACFTLLQTAHIRSIKYGTQLMVHNVAMIMRMGGAELYIRNHETEKIDKEIIEIECKRINTFNCKETLGKLRDTETYLANIGEMFKYNFIDRVYPNIDL